MGTLTALPSSNEYAEETAKVLQDVIETKPDAAIVISYWKSNNSYQIRIVHFEDRIKVIGLLEETKYAIIYEGEVN